MQKVKNANPEDILISENVLELKYQLKSWPFKFLLKHRRTSVRRHDEISTIYTSFNQSDLSNVMSLVKRRVYGRNFVVPAYARTLVLRKKLRRSQLKKIVRFDNDSKVA